MAFNPFNIFRRNQKAIFAVITVFIMFTFVLSSGLGGGADFFDWFPRWLGGKGTKGDQYCTIDGTKVYERDVRDIRFKRVIANRFMALAADQTLDNLQRYLFEQMAQGSPEFKFQFQMAMQNPMFAGMLAEEIERNPRAKDADKAAAKTLAVMSGLVQARQRTMMAGSYFATAPNRNARDVIEFMLWDKKAEQLGIKFTTDDVKQLIQKEFLGQFKSDVEVRRVMEKEYPGQFSLDAVLHALAAEFRVRTAQTAILGPVAERSDRTLSAAPIFNPPYELFEFYRDKTSPTTYEVLAVPAASFVSLVTATPTDAELKDLFDRRKDYEPDPSKEEPGFKEPRKVKVEWVSATGDEPYYRKQAAEWLAQSEKFLKSEVWALTVPVPGMWAGSWAAVVAAPASVKEPHVYAEYKKLADSHKMMIAYRWGGLTTFVLPQDILDTSVVKPQNLVAAVGGGAGAAAGFGGPFLPGTLLQSATIAAEQRARVRAGIPLFLGAVPGPGMLATVVGSEAAYRSQLPDALPVEALKPELIKTLTETKARDLAKADLKKLQDEVNKLTDNGKAKDKGPAKDYVAEFVKARGLKTGATSDFVNEWTVGDDPGMAALKAVKEKGADGRDPHTGLPGAGAVQFGQKFFYTTDPMTRSKAPAVGTYKPEFYPERAAEMPASPLEKPEPIFLAWRTDEKPAKSQTFTEAKPKVVEAWKRLKARDLARAEADRLAADVRNFSGAAPAQFVPHLYDLRDQLQAKIADPKAKERVKVIRVENVAPFQIESGPAAMGRDPIKPFQLAASADFPYPTPDMTKVLLDERTKPAKTVAVLADQPKDTYYVAVVEKRDERTANEFRDHVYGGLGSSGQIRQGILGAHARESVTKARDSILALIKKEFNYQETDEQKKRLDERERKGED